MWKPVHNHKSSYYFPLFESNLCIVIHYWNQSHVSLLVFFHFANWVRCIPLSPRNRGRAVVSDSLRLFNPTQIPAIGAPLDWAIQLLTASIPRGGWQFRNWAIGNSNAIQSNFPQFNESGRISQGRRDTRKFLKRDPQPAIGGPFLHSVLY